jgi:rhodanese-related sulfurtransferase
MRPKWSFWSKFLIIGVLAGFLTCGVVVVKAAADEVPLITKDELKPGLGSPHVTIIDVRKGKDWNASEKKIKGAVREDPDKVEVWAKKYQQYQYIVLYCACPNEWTSSRVGRRLKDMGFTQVSVLKGGWHEWFRSGYPTEDK